MKNSQLGSGDQVKTWLDTQPNPKDMFKPYSFDEMKTALQNWLNPGEDEIIDEEKVVEEAPKTNYSLKHIYQQR